MTTAPHIPPRLFFFRRVSDHVGEYFGFGVSTYPPARKCCHDFAGNQLDVVGGVGGCAGMAIAVVLTPSATSLLRARANRGTVTNSVKTFNFLTNYIESNS